MYIWHLKNTPFTKASTSLYDGWNQLHRWFPQYPLRFSILCPLRDVQTHMVWLQFLHPSLHPEAYSFINFLNRSWCNSQKKKTSVNILRNCCHLIQHNIVNPKFLQQEKVGHLTELGAVSIWAEWNWQRQNLHHPSWTSRNLRQPTHPHKHHSTCTVSQQENTGGSGK